MTMDQLRFVAKSSGHLCFSSKLQAARRGRFSHYISQSGRGAPIVLFLQKDRGICEIGRAEFGCNESRQYESHNPSIGEKIFWRDLLTCSAIVIVSFSIVIVLAPIWWKLLAGR